MLLLFLFYFLFYFPVSGEGCVLNNRLFLCIIETQQKERLHSARQKKDRMGMILCRKNQKKQY